MMAALAGKASYGTVSGSVKINGKADKLLRYKRVMGFVQQVRLCLHMLVLQRKWQRHQLRLVP